MNSIIWLFAGAALGWLATMMIRRRQPILWLNLIVGITGSFVAGYLLYPMLPESPIKVGVFSLPALLVSLGGAVFLLAAVNFVRREKIVKNDVIDEKWKLLSDHIQARWGKITEEDIAKINGDHKQFCETLQARYGIDKKEAEDQIQRYVKSISGIN